MLDVMGIKKKSREQLKGNYITALAAAVIQMGLIFALQLVADRLSGKRENIMFAFSIVNMLIANLASFAFLCLCTKIAQGYTISMYDFTEGFSHLRPAVLGKLWEDFCLGLWGFLCIIPIIVVTTILISTRLSHLNFSEFIENGIHFSETITSSDSVTTFLKSSVLSVLITFFSIICLLVIMVLKSLQYSLARTILAENKKMSVFKALRLSIVLTKGHKGDILGLVLGFIPWILLAFVPALIINRLAFNNTLVRLAYCTSLSFILPYYVTSLVNAYNAIKSNAIATAKVKIEDFQ